MSLFISSSRFHLSPTQFPIANPTPRSQNSQVQFGVLPFQPANTSVYRTNRNYSERKRKIRNKQGIYRKKKDEITLPLGNQSTGRNGLMARTTTRKLPANGDGERRRQQREKGARRTKQQKHPFWKQYEASGT